MVSIDFHSMEKNTMEIKGTINSSVTHILQNNFNICVQQKKEMYTDLE